MSNYQPLRDTTQLLSYAESAVAQMTRAFLVTAKSGHLGNCRRFHKFVYCQGLIQWGWAGRGGTGRANNKGKPDQLTRFRHYHLDKLGNMTPEGLTAANILPQRDALWSSTNVAAKTPTFTAKVGRHTPRKKRRLRIGKCTSKATNRGPLTSRSTNATQRNANELFLSYFNANYNGSTDFNGSPQHEPKRRRE